VPKGGCSGRHPGCRRVGLFSPAEQTIRAPLWAGVGGRCPHDPRCFRTEKFPAAELKLATRRWVVLFSSVVFNQEHFMADAANRYPDNVAGKYFVDNQCIDCDLCRETAPDNFKRNDDGGFSFVFKQPESPEEEERCKEAMEGCPVEAIGNNG
jgi:ferredoxin